MLGWNAVGLFRPHPHELDAATRHDKGLEAVGSQIGQQFDHRLIDELVIGSVSFVLLVIALSVLHKEVEGHCAASFLVTQRNPTWLVDVSTGSA